MPSTPGQFPFQSEIGHKPYDQISEMKNNNMWKILTEIEDEQKDEINLV